MGVEGPDRLSQTQAAIAALFPASVAVAATDPRRATYDAKAAEAAHLAHALPKRQREFAAGRSAALIAMCALGVAPEPVFAGQDRAPIWPAGLRGSISHSDTLCAAALTRAPLSVGLDLEPFTPLSPALLPEICTPQERAQTQGPDQLLLGKLIFSAKEAAYKAQYPLTGALFGFDHLAVTLDETSQQFEAQFLKPAGCFCTGDRLVGKWAIVAEHVVTAVTFHTEQQWAL